MYMRLSLNYVLLLAFHATDFALLPLLLPRLCLPAACCYCAAPFAAFGALAQ
jgi:hypothetical protein